MARMVTADALPTTFSRNGISLPEKGKNTRVATVTVMRRLGGQTDFSLVEGQKRFSPAAPRLTRCSPHSVGTGSACLKKIQTPNRFKRTLIYHDIDNMKFSGKSPSLGHQTTLNSQTVKNNEKGLVSFCGLKKGISLKICIVLSMS